jgi:hypothetical protein
MRQACLALDRADSAATTVVQEGAVVTARVARRSASSDKHRGPLAFRIRVHHQAARLGTAAGCCAEASPSARRADVISCEWERAANDSMSRLRIAARPHADVRSMRYGARAGSREHGQVLLRPYVSVRADPSHSRKTRGAADENMTGAEETSLSTRVSALIAFVRSMTRLQCLRPEAAGRASRGRTVARRARVSAIVRTVLRTSEHVTAR